MDSPERKILLGTIGYHNLGNHSIGPLLLPEIQNLPWADRVTVQEMNWGPIAIVQEFQSRSSGFERVVLLCAVERPGRTIGSIDIFQWAGGELDDAVVQDCIGDAVTGVISVQNLLIIGEYFKIWPDEVLLLDIEPGPEHAGMQLTPEVREQTDMYLQVLQRMCLEGLAPDMDSQRLTAKSLYAPDTIV